MTLLADDWSQTNLKKGTSPLDTMLRCVIYESIDESWYSYSVHANVCQNAYDGLWYYSINGEGPDMRAPCRSRQWAMLLAQEERLRRPERIGMERWDALYAGLVGLRDACRNSADAIRRFGEVTSPHASTAAVAELPLATSALDAASGDTPSNTRAG